MLASLGVCLVNLILIFALPTLANAVAVFGSVLIESRIYHFRPAWLVASRSSRRRRSLRPLRLIVSNRNERKPRSFSLSPYAEGWRPGPCLPFPSGPGRTHALTPGAPGPCWRKIGDRPRNITHCQSESKVHPLCLLVSRERSAPLALHGLASAPFYLLLYGREPERR
jgi:hypothetical protein